MLDVGHLGAVNPGPIQRHRVGWLLAREPPTLASIFMLTDQARKGKPRPLLGGGWSGQRLWPLGRYGGLV